MEKIAVDKACNMEIVYGMLGYAAIDPERKYAEILSHNIEVSNFELIKTIIDLIKHYGYVDIFRSGLIEYRGMDAFANMMDADEIERLADLDEQSIPYVPKDVENVSTENVNMEKVVKKLSAVFNSNDIIGNQMNYEKHRMFCRTFIKEFGFMPIIVESQRDLNLDVYMSVIDAFDIYFTYIYESPENTKKTIISSDYYAILKNYIANQELLHKEVIDHTKWLNMIEVARDTFTVKMIDEDYITVPDF